MYYSRYSVKVIFLPTGTDVWTNGRHQGIPSSFFTLPLLALKINHGEINVQNRDLEDLKGVYFVSEEEPI